MAAARQPWHQQQQPRRASQKDADVLAEAESVAKVGAARAMDFWKIPTKKPDSSATSSIRPDESLEAKVEKRGDIRARFEKDQRLLQSKEEEKQRAAKAQVELIAAQLRETRLQRPADTQASAASPKHPTPSAGVAGSGGNTGSVSPPKAGGVAAGLVRNRLRLLQGGSATDDACEQAPSEPPRSPSPPPAPTPAPPPPRATAEEIEAAKAAALRALEREIALTQSAPTASTTRGVQQRFFIPASFGALDLSGPGRQCSHFRKFMLVENTPWGVRMDTPLTLFLCPAIVFLASEPTVGDFVLLHQPYLRAAVHADAAGGEMHKNKRFLRLRFMRPAAAAAASSSSPPLPAAPVQAPVLKVRFAPTATDALPSPSVVAAADATTTTAADSAVSPVAAFVVQPPQEETFVLLTSGQEETEYWIETLNASSI